jgi:hypothetical protein
MKDLNISLHEVSDGLRNGILKAVLNASRPDNRQVLLNDFRCRHKLLASVFCRQTCGVPTILRPIVKLLIGNVPISENECSQSVHCEVICCLLRIGCRLSTHIRARENGLIGTF